MLYQNNSENLLTGSVCLELIRLVALCHLTCRPKNMDMYFLAKEIYLRKSQRLKIIGENVYPIRFRKKKQFDVIVLRTFVNF